MNLREILRHHNINGSEKKGTDKDTKHSYLGIYEEIFREYKNKTIEILELGVQFGGSSLLWHDYFLESNLTLIDIEELMTDEIKSKLDQRRYNYIISDAYQQKIIEILGDKKFDIIIDDGPHTIQSQKFVINSYSKFLHRDSIMVIEDIQSYDNLKELIKITEEKKLKYEVINLINIKGRYDDILLIIKLKND